MTTTPLQRFAAASLAYREILPIPAHERPEIVVERNARRMAELAPNARLELVAHLVYSNPRRVADDIAARADAVRAVDWITREIDR